VLQRSNEFAQNEPSSEICATLIGPERAVLAPKVRWTIPNVPLHLLPPPSLHSLLPTVPIVSRHSSSTGSGPAPGATGIVALEAQLSLAGS
jgi:hypothetical protein